MSTPFKQMPGRGNYAKTGHGIPSALRQANIELTKNYDEGKTTTTNNIQKGNIPSGLNVNPNTSEFTPKLPMHSVVKSGTYVRELDSKGGVVREEAMDSKGNENFYKSVTNHNNDVTKRQTNNASFMNAIGGGTKPENLSASQVQALVNTRKARRTT